MGNPPDSDFRASCVDRLRENLSPICRIWALVTTSRQVVRRADALEFHQFHEGWRLTRLHDRALSLPRLRASDFGLPCPTSPIRRHALAATRAWPGRSRTPCPG